MGKKVWIIWGSLITLFMGVLLYIAAQPIIGVASMFFDFLGSQAAQENRTEEEVENYLQQKYNLSFNTDVKVDGFVSTNMTAFPEKDPSYTFPVKKHKDQYIDYFFDAIYKEDIQSALKRYPKLEWDQPWKLSLFFDPLASIGQTFNYKDTYPKLSESPIPLTVKISSNLEAEGLNREEVLGKFQEVIRFLQEESIPHQEFISTIQVDAPDYYYYYNYTIPKEAFSDLKTVENLKSFENVKVVKQN